MQDEILNVTAQLFLFWRAFSDHVERNLPGNKATDNSSQYYYGYEDDYSAEMAADSVNKLLAANSTRLLKNVADEHFQRADWRLMADSSPGELNRILQLELASISKLTRRPTRFAEDPISSYAVYFVSIWIERYLYPPMLFIGLFGNALTYVVLSRPVISQQGSSAVYLKMLCIHDTINLFLGVTRKWIQNFWRLDIRETSTFMCKVHRFAHYTCLDASHWILAAITIDRVIAVVWPFQAIRCCRRKVAFVVIGVIWLFFGSLNSFVLLGVGLEPVQMQGSRVVHIATTTQQLPNFLRAMPAQSTITVSGQIPMPIVRYQCKFIDKDAEYFAINFHRWLIAAFYILGPFGLVLGGNIIITKKLFERKSFLDSMHRGIGRIRRGSGCENQVTLRTTTTMLFISSATFLILGTPTFVLLVSGPYFEPQLNKTNEGKAYLFFLRAIESFMTYLNHSSHIFFYTMLGTQFRKEFWRAIKKVISCFAKMFGLKRRKVLSREDSEQKIVVLPTVSSICIRPNKESWFQVDPSEFGSFTPAAALTDVEQQRNGNFMYPRDQTFDSGLGMSTSPSGAFAEQRVREVLQRSVKYRRRRSLDSAFRRSSSISKAKLNLQMKLNRSLTLSAISETDGDSDEAADDDESRMANLRRLGYSTASLQNTDENNIISSHTPPAEF